MPIMLRLDSARNRILELRLFFLQLVHLLAKLRQLLAKLLDLLAELHDPLGELILLRNEPRQLLELLLNNRLEGCRP